MTSPLLPQRPDGRYELRLDASLLSESSCSRRIYHLLLEGLKSREDTWKMDFGTAVHKFLACWYGGKSQPYAMDAALNYYREIPVPETDWRDLTALEKVCEGYVKAWPVSDEPLEVHSHPVIVGEDYKEDKYALEKHFEIEWLSTDTLVVILCGTMDFRGVIRRPDGSEEKVIVDHKSTALYRGFKSEDNAIKDILAEKVRTIQGDIYRLAARRLWGEDYGFMINGIFLKKDGKHRYERSEVFRRSKEADEDFLVWLTYTINEIIGMFEASSEGWAQKSWPTNRLCCSEPWPCKFSPLCDAPSTDQVEFIKRECFVQKIYDPRTFGGAKD